MGEASHIIEQCLGEITFVTSRSGGSGGQHVNKVETKVTLVWDIEHSASLTPGQKEILKHKLANYVTDKGVMKISHQTERSQLKNKQLVISKWKKHITTALKKTKRRKPTKPTLESKKERRKSKEKRSQVKMMRKRPSID